MPSPSSDKVYTHTHRGCKYPTLGFVLSIHDAVIAETGGASGIRDKGLIVSALHAPVESLGEADAYPRFLDKVAALGFRLVTNHGFVDGNKRTSLIVLDQTLRWEGLYLSHWSDETKTLVMSLVGASYLDQYGLRHALILGCGLDPADPNLP